MKFYTTEKIGPKRSRTREGFLLCEDVPIARTGLQIYGPGETPIVAGPDGVVRIERDAEEVFRPETVASFTGKPVVDEHPDSDVTSDNWSQLIKGVVMHPRRGEGVEDDVLMADLLIYDQSTIDQILSNKKKEISCGYDADYEADAEMPGRGFQVNILGNHVALVSQGRCGPRCAIGDHRTTDCCDKEATSMTVKERLLKAIRGKDEGAAVALLDELPDDGKTAGNTHVHIHAPVRDEDKEDKKDDDKDDKDHKTMDAAIDKRFRDVEDTLDAQGKDIKAIKDAVMDKDDKDDDDDDKKEKTEDEEPPFGAEAPPGTNDRAWAKNSTVFEESFQETVALAEIIAPGIGVPTFDAKAKPRKTYDMLCSFRRRVLDEAYSVDRDARRFMDEITGGREIKQYTCDGVRSVFRAVGVMKRNANNAAARTTDASPVGTGTGGGGGVRGAIKTNAELNRRLAEFYKEAR